MAIRVIVADDSTTVQKVLKLILAPKGYLVECYGSGTDAFDAIRKNRPDVIFVDAVMPGMNGIDLGAKIQKSHKELQSIPIVLMHSTFDEISASDLKLSGAKAKLVKPFDDQQVIDLVAKLSALSANVSAAASQKQPPSQPPKQPPVKEDGHSANWSMESFVPPEMPSFEEPLKTVEEQQIDEDGFMKFSDDEKMDELGVPEPHELSALRDVPSFEVQKPLSEETLSEHEAKKLLDEFDLSENPDGSIAFKENKIDVKIEKKDNKVNVVDENIDTEKDMGLWGDRFYAKSDDTDIPDLSSLPGETQISAANIEFGKSYSVASSDPVSQIKNDEAIQRMTRETIERMLRQMLPEMAERIIREEISKIIGK